MPRRASRGPPASHAARVPRQRSEAWEGHSSRPGPEGGSLSMLTVPSSLPLSPSWHIWSPCVPKSGEVGAALPSQPSCVPHFLAPWSPPSSTPSLLLCPSVVHIWPGPLPGGTCPPFPTNYHLRREVLLGREAAPPKSTWQGLPASLCPPRGPFALPCPGTWSVTAAAALCWEPGLTYLRGGGRTRSERRQGGSHGRPAPRRRVRCHQGAQRLPSPGCQ